MVPFHYYVHDVGLWPVVTNWLQSDFGFNQFAFTPYSLPHVWTNTIPDTPLTNILTSQSFLQEVMEQSRRKPAGKQPPPSTCCGLLFSDVGSHNDIPTISHALLAMLFANNILTTVCILT
jgi:hypothetical protein